MINNAQNAIKMENAHNANKIVFILIRNLIKKRLNKICLIL